MRLFSTIVLLLVVNLMQAQTTIWLENFNSYADDVNAGQGDPKIASWTADGIEVPSWITVKSNKLEGRRTDHKQKELWRIDDTDLIEIGGFSNVSVSIELSSTGTENGDYIEVKYSIDGGALMHFPNSPFGGTVSTTASISGLSGSSLKLEIGMYNNHNGDYYYADNITVTGTHIPATWTGTTSTDWNDGSNWSTGVVPLHGNTVTIPSSPSGGNFPETNTGSGAVLYDLTIESGAHLYVPADNSLSVFGTLSNAAGATALVLQSNSSGTASLTHNTNTVNATVEQYLTANEWHYVSSPISNATANTFYGIYLRSFNETTYAWNDYIIEPSTSLTTMLGYAAWVDGANTTVSFEGPLNNGSTSIPVTYTGTATNPGWNLVGNPFPSAIDWNSTSGWGSRTNFYNAIYFWEGVGGGGGGNYHYYVGSFNPPDPTGPVGTVGATQFIPANQAFFVRATGNVSLSVNNDARVHNSQSYWKSTVEIENQLIRLSAQNEAGLQDETIIRFVEGASSEFDGTYDAYKLAGYMFPQLYSITPEETKLAISTLPGYEDGSIIPLGFEAPEAGNYSINLSEFENFNGGLTLYLEDLLLDQIIDLSANSSYNFSASQDDDPNRFLLHFNESLTAVESTEESSVSIHSHGNTLYVKLSDAKNQGVVNVYTMMGQTVLESKISGGNLHRMNLEVPAGTYLVTVQLDERFVSEKVFIY